MAITLLSAIRSICGARAMPRPTAVINSTNETFIQMAEAANRLVWFLASQETWQGLVKKGQFTSIAGSEQGEMKTLVSDQGYQSLLGTKIFNYTDSVVYEEPQASENWQHGLHIQRDIPEGQFRIYGNKLYLHSDMPAGKSIRFEYYSKYLVKPASGADKESFTLDTDTCLLDDRIFIMGTEWMWLSLKGMENATAEATFMALLNKLIRADTTAPDIHLTGEQLPRQGSWTKPVRLS